MRGMDVFGSVCCSGLGRRVHSLDFISEEPHFISTVRFIAFTLSPVDHPHFVIPLEFLTYRRADLVPQVVQTNTRSYSIIIS